MPLNPDAALFEAGTAAQLLIERRRTLERIERMGVPTLDAEPRRLSGRLISRWLQSLVHALDSESRIRYPESYWKLIFRRIGPLRDGTAVWQMHHPGRIDGVDGPGQPQRFGYAGVRAARGKAARQRRARIKAELLVVKRAGTAAGVDVCFQHSDAVPGLQQQCPGRQPANASANYEGVGRGGVCHGFSGWWLVASLPVGEFASDSLTRYSQTGYLPLATLLLSFAPANCRPT